MFRCLFESVDLDDCREQVGRVFKPHRLDLLGRGQALSARMDHLRHGALSLSRLRYGADVAITPGPLGDFYLLQMPITGAARITVDGRPFDSRPGVASLLSPAPDLAMRWSGASDQMILRIESARLLTLASQWAGHDVASLNFDPRTMVDARSPLLRVLREAFDARARLGPLLDTPPVTEPLEHLVVGLLLHGQSNPLTASLARPVPGLPVRLVTETEAYLAAHAQEPHSAGTLAARHRVSVRALFLAFHRCRGYGPMHFLREVRLHRVRAALRGDEGSADRACRDGAVPDVTAIAMQWGFGHLGRFSQAYTRRFGEKPSDTRRRRLH